MKNVVKLNASQFHRLVSGIINEEKTFKRLRSFKITESSLRRIVREEMMNTRPQGVEFKSGSGKGPNIDVDDDKIDQLLGKLSSFDLSDDEIDSLVSKLKAESRRRRGRRL